MHQFKALSLAWLVPFATATASAAAAVCSTVSFQVSATAQNEVFLSPPNPNNETQVLNFFYVGLANGTGPAVKGTTSVSGTFTIGGTYCCPGPCNEGTVLEVLVHGISYNRALWSGLGQGNTYNWQSYAASRGYCTLAIDRLGHGTNPQHPDPLNVVQGRMQIEIIHQIINAVRTKSKNPLGRTFNKVIYVSHSYAGWLGIGLANAYPTDADAMVLTGFSAAVNFTPFAFAELESYSRLRPAVLPGLPLGYITFELESQREADFYAGAYSKTVALADYALEDTWTIGETGNLGFVVPPPSYTGPLYLATGVNDKIFCEAPLSACQSILSSTQELFPGVTKFGYTAVSNTGHTLMMHNSAQQTFANVHTFLDQVL